LTAKVLLGGVCVGCGVGGFVICVLVDGGGVQVGVGETDGVLGVKKLLFCATKANAAMLNARLSVTMTLKITVEVFMTKGGLGRFYIVYWTAHNPM
jgi:hypothetical protein